MTHYADMSRYATPTDVEKYPEFPKIARLNREMVVTEKIDGTNAQIHILGESIRAGSRTRWITPDDDNYGFARWVWDHSRELVAGLGDGYHFGEWWGQGIQRKYGLDEKRFSLFNTGRWDDTNKPACCDVVPLLYKGPFKSEVIEDCVRELRKYGSVAAPGFMKAEGVVVWHEAARQSFKVTVEKDNEYKGLALVANG